MKSSSGKLTISVNSNEMIVIIIIIIIIIIVAIKITTTKTLGLATSMMVNKNIKVTWTRLKYCFQNDCLTYIYFFYKYLYKTQ